MRKILLPLALCISVFVHSQEQTRVINTPSSLYTGSLSLVADSSHLYFNVFEGDIAFEEVVKAQWLYKLDHNLNTQDSIDLTPFLNLVNQEYPRFHDLKIQGNHLYCLIEIQSQQPKGICTYTFRTSLLKLDTNLNFISSTEFENDSTYFSFYTMDLDSLGNIYLGGRAGHCDSGVAKAVVKVYPNKTTNKLSYLNALPSTARAGYLQTIHFFKDKLVAGTAPFNSVQRNSTLVIDTALNLLNIGSVNISGLTSMAFFRPYEQQFLHYKSGEIHILGITTSFIVSPTGDPNYYNLGFSVLDTNYNVTAIDTLPLIGHYPPNSITIRPYPYLNPRAGYDYKNPDSLILAVNHSGILFDTYAEQDTNTFSLYNYNLRTKTLNWRKQIKTGLTNGGHNVAALPGNRYALTFNQYNWRDFTEPNLSLHIWILNGAGDIISTKEYQQTLPQWAVYPNPVQEQLTLPKESTKNAVLPYTVFNTQGANLRQGVLEKGQTQITVENLPAGSYVLQSPKGIARFVKN